MIIEKTKVWLIMSKDRQFVAKGSVRNRHLIRIDDKKDKKRYLSYSSKAKAESAFTVSGFYGQGQLIGHEYGKPLIDLLEAVECELILNAI